MTKEQTMSPLRTRMIEDMQLAGLSAKTQKVYLQAVTALVKHYRNRLLDQLTEEEVHCYVLAVRQRNARGTFKTCHYGIQFFYRSTLGKDWVLFKKRSGSDDSLTSYLRRCRHSYRLRYRRSRPFNPRHRARAARPLSNGRSP